MRRIKHIPALLSFGLLGLIAQPVQASAPGKEITINEANFAKLCPEDQQRVLAIKDRLEEVATIDRSTLTREEKRTLRVEVKGLNEEAKTFNRDGTVIYLSTGAIIIILLLIILL